jgi:hypothetical protein
MNEENVEAIVETVEEVVENIGPVLPVKTFNKSGLFWGVVGGVTVIVVTAVGKPIVRGVKGFIDNQSAKKAAKKAAKEAKIEVTVSSDEDIDE